jgi:hypothetical protein
MTSFDPSADADRDLDQTTELQRDILRSLDGARREPPVRATSLPADQLSADDQSRGPDGGATGGTAIGNAPGITTDGRS